MRTRSLTAALLCASLLAAPGLALAQATSGSAPDPAAAGSGTVVGLASAIEAAKGRLDGGVLEAELETRDGNLVYEIDLVADGSVHQAIVNAQTGEVVSLEEQTLTGTWAKWFDADRLQAAQGASGTLADALASAEQQVGGQVTEASLEEENGRLFYEVEVETAQGDQEALIDTGTGEVTLGERDD